MSILQQLTKRIYKSNSLITLWPNFKFWSWKIFLQENAEIEWANFEICPAGSTRTMNISVDNHVCNELLRLSWKFEAKILKNVRDNSVYNFLVNCWRIDMSVVEELTCQLLVHVGHNYGYSQTSKLHGRWECQFCKKKSD